MGFTRARHFDFALAASGLGSVIAGSIDGTAIFLVFVVAVSSVANGICEVLGLSVVGNVLSKPVAPPGQLCSPFELA